MLSCINKLSTKIVLFHKKNKYFISFRYFGINLKNGNGVLLREWIKDSLYNKKKGYFIEKADILGNSISFNLKNFSKLNNKDGNKYISYIFFYLFYF